MPVLSECGFCLLLGFDVVKLWCSRVGDGNCPIINEKKKKEVLASKLKDVVKEDQNKLTACWWSFKHVGGSAGAEYGV